MIAAVDKFKPELASLVAKLKVKAKCDPQYAKYVKESTSMDEQIHSWCSAANLSVAEGEALEASSDDKLLQATMDQVQGVLQTGTTHKEGFPIAKLRFKQLLA